MKKLFTLVTMMILLGVNRAWAGPYVYFNESSKVLNAGATSFDFMSNQLMSSGISTNSGTQQTVFSGWVVFNENAKMTHSENNNGGTAYGDPFDIIDIGSGQFNNINALQAGWTLRVNFDFAQDDWYGWFFKNHTTEVYSPIQNNLNKVDGWHQVTLNGNTFWSMYGYYEAVLTADAVTYLKGNGINLRGRSITIQSVEVIPPATTFDASSFDWTAETYGEVEITDGYSNKTGNNTYTLSTSSPNLVLNGEGGSIVFIANGKSGTAVAGYRAYYVVTVPYPDNHVWDFFTEPGITPRADAYWTDDYKSKAENGNNNHKIKVATPNESATDGYNYINQTNAFYIPETAGLLFDVKSARLGYNNEGGKKLVTWGGYHITSTGSNNDGTHPKFTIPQVQGGKYIKVWWNAMAQGQGGAKFNVTNLLDLEGKSIDNEFSISGVTYYDQCLGCVIFKVKGEGRQDVTFTLNDQGWNDLYKIEITDEYSTDLELDDITNSAWDARNYVKYNNEYASIVHDGNGTSRTYSGVPGPLYIQRGRTCAFEYYLDGNVTVDASSGPVATGTSGQYTNLQLNGIKGTGNIRIVVKEVFENGYVLDKKETWLAVGTYTQQSYPYTWDFTDYNVKKGKLTSRLSHIPTEEVHYGYWEQVDNTNDNSAYGLDTHVLVDASKVNDSNNNISNYVWNNVQIEKPLFAQGAQLTYCTTNYGVGIIDETEGLRIKQCNDSESELGVGDNYDREVQFNIKNNGGCLKFVPRSRLNHKLYITIPNVTQGMWVFIKASRIPDAVKVGANTLSVDTKSNGNPDTYDTQDDVWAYEVTNTGDVDICYQGEAGVDIEAIGVTDIFKSINLLGYATESRNHAIDHKYEGIFTNNDVNAYCILTNNGFTYNYKGTPVVVKSNQEVNVVPENTGIVLYKSGHDKTKGGFNVPLFYPACNVKETDEEKSLYTESNMMAPNVIRTKHEDVVETWHGEECQKFVMSRQYYIYNKTYNSNSEEKTSEQEAFYRMRLNVAGTSNWMEANKAYLLIPSTKLPLALWNPESDGEGKPGYAKPGVIFMDDIMDLFGGEEPFSGIATAIDTIESTETVGNGNTFHTLSGMQIQGVPTQKGVYIVNGKKVLVK